MVLRNDFSGKIHTINLAVAVSVAEPDPHGKRRLLSSFRRLPFVSHHQPPPFLTTLLARACSRSLLFSRTYVNQLSPAVK